MESAISKNFSNHEAILSGVMKNIPLIPKIENSKSFSKNIREASENQLFERLASAKSRQSQCEENLSPTWSVNDAVFRDNFDFADDIKGAPLPKHVEENIKDIAQSAQDYIDKLQEQLQDLDYADERIDESAKKALQEIDEEYQNLLDDVCLEINRKRDIIKLETEVHKMEGYVPLKVCRQEVKAEILSAQHLIDLVQRMLKYPHTFNRERFQELLNASSNLGRIPAVPLPEELPCVTFSRPTSADKEQLLSKISDIGFVSRIGPVQFSEIKEKPASLFVKWQIIDTEYMKEEQVFILQIATDDKFQLVYEGPETSFFIRDLPVDQFITLRIGIETPQIIWSLPRTVKTTLSHYTWDLSNKNYIITNSGRVAAKITDEEKSILLSRGPQFDSEQIIEFKFLEAATDSSDNEGIALLSEIESSDNNLRRKGVLLITPKGKIYMDGKEKLMRLPKVCFATRIIFTATKKDEDTLRINIESADKAVTYDWSVKTPLYFAVRFFKSNKWNILVK